MSSDWCPWGSLERLGVSVGTQNLVSVAPQDRDGVHEGILRESLRETFVLDSIGTIRGGMDRKREGFLGSHGSRFVRGSLGIP